MTRSLITCALPYANAAIHFGHLAGVYLPADIFARYSRLKKDDVLFICGSDEYGMAVTMSAYMTGRSPQEHVDYFHQTNLELFQKVGMSWDHYSRTSWKGHIEPVQKYFLDLVKNGYIEEKWSKHLYSPKEQKFLADRYVEGGCPKCGFDRARGDECPKCGASYEATDLIRPRSKLTGAPLETRDSKHWFLRLDLFKEPLERWLQTKSWKSNVVNFVKGYIDDLRPRAITRDCEWGVPVPLEGAEGKVLYVWFDAPIGYVSAAMEWAQKIGKPEAWKDFWMDESSRLVQFLGKDNIPFHAVIFPAMTMGQDLPLKLVDEMPANEFYNLEGKKFSKSEGWSIDLAEFLSKYDPQTLRYMLAATAPENSDSEFTWKEFQMRVNAELVGKWGNFIHRTLTFVQKMSGRCPKKQEPSEEDHYFLIQMRAKIEELEHAYSHFRVRRASQLVMEMAQLCNGYFDAQKPWVLLKESRLDDLDRVMGVCLKAIQWLLVVSSPILPDPCEKAWKWIGFTKSIQELGWKEGIEQPLPYGEPIASPQLLFGKIEDDQIVLEQDLLRKRHEEYEARIQKSNPDPFVEECVSFESFQKFDIRSGRIVKAQRVPKSNKLLQLQIDFGCQEKQVISGIGHVYEPESLVGKDVVCVVNLKPALIMGLKSEAMILAASKADGLEVIMTHNVPPGSKVR